MNPPPPSFFFFSPRLHCLPFLVMFVCVCTAVIGMQLNPESEVVLSGAVIDPSVLEKEHSVGTPLQVIQGEI